MKAGTSLIFFSVHCTELFNSRVQPANGFEHINIGYVSDVVTACKHDENISRNLLYQQSIWLPINARCRKRRIFVSAPQAYFSRLT